MSASASNRDYVRRALAILARDAPAHHAALVHELRALPGVYRVGTETFAIVVRGDAVAVDDALPPEPALDVAIAASDVVRLIDGTAMVETLLADERLRIFASALALLRLARLVATMLEGALHLRAMQDLFEDYRGWVARGGDSAAPSI